MFFKSVLLGLKRKIGEPIMILVTVAIAVATLVSAIALRSSVRQSAADAYRALSGSAELEASLDESSAYYLTGDNEKYLSLAEESQKYGTLYAGYRFYASLGKEEGAFAEVYATDITELTRYNPVTYLSGKGEKTRTGVVLSEVFAEKIGARVGDSLTATRYGSSVRVGLTVTGIAAGKGVFAQADALISQETASRLLSVSDSIKIYNRFFIDLSEQKLADLGVGEGEATAALQQAFPDWKIASPVNDANVEVTLSYQSTLLFVIAIIVAALGAVLIYTAVTLVMKNRVAAAALFKSVGATNGGLVLYLLSEILIYGVLGSLLGIAASYGVGALFGAATGSTVSFALSWGSALVGLAFGVVLSLLSALIPVLSLAFSPLYDLLHARSSVQPVKWIPAVIAGGVFLALFLGTAFAGVTSAFLLGIFAFVSLLVCVFTLIPLAVKGVSLLICRLTKNSPKAGKLYLAATGAESNRHAQSGARLFAIAVVAVVSVAVLLGVAAKQLSSFESLFRSDIMVTSTGKEIVGIAEEVRGEEGVKGAYLAYMETRCGLEGNEDNSVSLFAARRQEYEEVFNVDAFGVDVASLAGKNAAAMGGGLALKLGLEVGDEFTVITPNGDRFIFVLSSVIDTPLTVVFTDLTDLSVGPNVCLAQGDEGVFVRLSEKYALKGAVFHTVDYFRYVIDLADSYIKVFSVFEVLVFLFAFAGYLNSAIASYRDRKREYELLSSAGASKGDIRKMVLFENLIVVLTAAALGAAFSFALLFVVQNMLKSLGLYFALLG